MTGKQLKERRQTAGLSQEAAAHTAGVSWTTWQRWEKRAELPLGTVEQALKAIQTALRESLKE